MRRSSARRGQVEPLAALAALVVLTFALGAYVVAVDAARPPTTDRSVAEPTLRRAVDALRPGSVVRPARLDGLDALRPGSVVRPARLDGLDALAPAGYAVNVSVRTGKEAWTRGPRPPADADTDAASERATVSARPGRVRPGRVRVVVWR